MAENDRTHLIVGLGNPGAEYCATRHNVGFLVIDGLARRWGLSGLSSRSKFGGELGQVHRSGFTVFLLKPMSYMNLSGGPVGQVAQFYQVPPAKVLVVCDDVNLPFGMLRLRGCGGAGGHKGLISISQVLGTEQYARLRVGVGGGEPGRDLTGFVLKRFPSDQTAQLDRVLERCSEALETVIERGLPIAMSQFNGNALEPDVKRSPVI